MLTNQQVAEAFSSHEFREVYDLLHPRATWTLVGEARLEGKEYGPAMSTNSPRAT